MARVMFVDADHVWAELLDAPGPSPRPCLFLDRDGVVVEEVHYLRRPEDVRLIPGAAEVIRRANRLGVPVVVVSNQAGVGRGIFDWPAFAAVQARIIAELAQAGARLAAVYACPHHPEGEPPYRHADHPARKPNPGMLLAAAERLAIDLAASWIVGDRASDLEAGRNGGLAGGMHVLTGYGSNGRERPGAAALADGRFAVRLEASVADALDAIPLIAAEAAAISGRRTG